jgi:hypothetical protein
MAFLLTTDPTARRFFAVCGIASSSTYSRDCKLAAAQQSHMSNRRMAVVQVYDFQTSNLLMSVFSLLFSLAFLAFIYFFGEAPASWANRTVTPAAVAPATKKNASAK